MLKRLGCCRLRPTLFNPRYFYARIPWLLYTDSIVNPSLGMQQQGKMSGPVHQCTVMYWMEYGDHNGSLSAAYTVEAVVKMLRQLLGMQQQRIAITTAWSVQLNCWDSNVHRLLRCFDTMLTLACYFLMIARWMLLMGRNIMSTLACYFLMMACSMSLVTHGQEYNVNFGMLFF